MRIIIPTLLVCAAALPALAQDVSGARDASQRFTSALGAADAPTAASFFTDDGVVLPPGRGEISNRTEIQRFLGGMTHSVKDLKYMPESQKPLDDTTVREIGSFSFKQKQGGDVSGKYLIVWTKVGSDWKIAADMWNRSSQGGGGKGGKGGPRGGAAADPE